jgi:hypothetical protein
MFSVSTLIAINHEIAAEAARRGSRPFVPFDEKDVDRWPPFPFPSLGGYEPLGWENAGRSWFVDATGRGSPWESALTVDAFKAELFRYVVENPGHGFAITEEGEFQVVVSAFRRVALVV